MPGMVHLFTGCIMCVSHRIISNGIPPFRNWFHLDAGPDQTKQSSYLRTYPINLISSRLKVIAAATNRTKAVKRPCSLQDGHPSINESWPTFMTERFIAISRYPFRRVCVAIGPFTLTFLCLGNESTRTHTERPTNPDAHIFKLPN